MAGGNRGAPVETSVGPPLKCGWLQAGPVPTEWSSSGTFECLAFRWDPRQGNSLCRMLWNNWFIPNTKVEIDDKYSVHTGEPVKSRWKVETA